MAYPFTLKISLVKSLYYLLYNFYNHISSENLVLDQPKIFLWILFFILYNHHLSAWYCIHLIIIRRDSVLVTFFLFFSFSLFFFHLQAPYLNLFEYMPDWYQIHAWLVSNACPIGIKYMPNWYQIHAWLVSNTCPIGIKYMPNWYQIHARLVSNTCPIGIKYMPDWYKKN